MTRVLITEGHLSDIAGAIRAKLESAETYTPGEMAGAIMEIGGGASAVIEPLSVTANGTYNAPTGVDGYAPVTVNVSSAVEKWPMFDDIVAAGSRFTALLNGTLPLDITEYSAYVQAFYNNYSTTKPSYEYYGITLTASDAGLSLAQLLEAHPSDLKLEYAAYTYGRTAMIEELGLVLLGDFSQGGADTGNALTDSIQNYSAVLLQGVYQTQRTSQYNTSMLHTGIELNKSYWAGMKDRSSAYDCNVTFTDDQTVSLTGNKQVIIYGMP